MQINIFLLTAFLAVVTLPTSVVAGQARGQATNYTSPDGVTEKCIVLASMPDSKYRTGDKKKEQQYCGIDIYDANTALCPKIWSTSPGTIIYDLTAGSYAGRVKEFEQSVCKHEKASKSIPGKKLAKFKSTMNTPETSGTFSTASLLYYQFSRYFDTAVNVPVAVWRSIDRRNHLQRVTESGVRHSRGSRMLHAGWLKMEAAEKDPTTYHPEDELFSAEGRVIYGALLNSPGHRYNTSVNGTRASGWGVGQNIDFQKTAPYLALRSDKPLTDAVRHGLQAARSNRKMNHDLGNDISEPQMVFWMTELTEITLLDFIFNQQDRIGNIDYISYWYWQEDGQLRRTKAHGTEIPTELADKSPLLLKRTQLNDNDAGGKLSYVNYTKKTKMLEKQRHYQADTYKKLLQLNHDFSVQGELYRYLRDTFGLSEKQLRLIVKNTAEATAILQKTCSEGKLRFDLSPDAFLRTGSIAEQKTDCEWKQ